MDAMIGTTESGRREQISHGTNAPVLGTLNKRSIATRLFLTCWLVYALHFATNTVREIFPALTLADHLSFDVSEYLGLHDDIFELPGRGAYINNNPGASILGAVPYAVTRPIVELVVEKMRISRENAPGPSPEYDSPYPMAREFYRQAYARGLDVKFGLAAAVMQMLLMAPLSALCVVVMFYVLSDRALSDRAAMITAVLYGFATPVFYRTAQLNQNLLVSHCALFAFVLLWRPWDKPSRPGRPRYLLAGLLCGWSVVLDYSGLVVAAALGLYALMRRRTLPARARSWADIPQFATPVLVCIGLLMAYQWHSFGHLLYPAQHYMPPTRYSGYGYSGMDWPKLDLLWQNAFGLRFGLFTSAPILLLSLYVPGWRQSGSPILGRLEVWFILLFSLVFFLFTAANQFSRMQFNSGVRHVVPVTPFLFLLSAGVLLRLPRPLAIVVGGACIYWSWCLAMYRDVEQGAGVWESVLTISSGGPQLPWLSTLERMGYVQGGLAAPVLALGAGVIWAIWRIGRHCPNPLAPIATIGSRDNDLV